MRGLRISVATVLAAAVLATGALPRTHAQTLSNGLFDRYLDALRQEFGIPGLSFAIVQNGVPVRDGGLGFQDVGAAIRARSDTPYPIANLTETIGSTLLLRQCIDLGTAELTDKVERWAPFPSESLTTLGQALGHLSAANIYQYDATRFGRLSVAATECAKQSNYGRVLATEILDRLSMTGSVPGRNAVDAPNAALFSAAKVADYRAVLARLALPYRVAASGTATRSDFPAATLDASTGLVSTVLDLAKFDAALSDDRNLLLEPETRSLAWAQTATRPTGLGWFVQTYNGEKLVWHFGVAPGAYSSLILKVPSRRLTLILLANSDGLGTSLSVTQPDVTKSLFAQTFLKLFVL